MPGLLALHLTQMHQLCLPLFCPKHLLAEMLSRGSENSRPSPPYAFSSLTPLLLKHVLLCQLAVRQGEGMAHCTVFCGALWEHEPEVCPGCPGLTFFPSVSPQ